MPVEGSCRKIESSEMAALLQELSVCFCLRRDKGLPKVYGSASVLMNIYYRLYPNAFAKGYCVRQEEGFAQPYFFLFEILFQDLKDGR